MSNSNSILGILGSACIAFGAGALWGMEQAPYITEESAAQTLAGDKSVRLIGFFCGDRAATVLAQWEDEFPEEGCKEIRRLKTEPL